MPDYRVEIDAYVCVSIRAENERDLREKIHTLLQGRFVEGEKLAESENFKHPVLYFLDVPNYDVADIDEVP